MFFSRGKNKAKNPITFKEMYLSYIKDKDESSPYYISYDLYVEICSKYINKIIEHIICKGKKFKLPYRLGELSIIKKKINLANEKQYLPIDWANSLKYGKTITHLNEHSSGYKYMFYWNKKKALFKNKSCYRLVFTRANKRMLAKLIKSNKVDYYE